jgi:hypothetical protein
MSDIVRQQQAVSKTSRAIAANIVQQREAIGQQQVATLSGIQFKSELASV